MPSAELGVRRPKPPKPDERCPSDGMCEVCDGPALDGYGERERVAASEGWRCEYAADEAHDPCGEPATWRERFAIATDHLCDEHKGETEGMEAEGLGTLLLNAGLGEGAYYVAIRGRKRCEFLGPRECEDLARWAEVSVLSSFSCDAHIDAE